jgi:hypothetical protein
VHVNVLNTDNLFIRPPTVARNEPPENQLVKPVNWFGNVTATGLLPINLELGGGGNTVFDKPITDSGINALKLV